MNASTVSAPEKRTVGDIGEKEIIRLLSDIFEQKTARTPFFPDPADDGAVYVGPGKDDCAILPLPPAFPDDGRASRTVMVCTTDMLHRKTDFPEDMSYYDIGWMSAAVNLSDIASMGAVPAFFLVSMGLPDALSVSSLISLARGMADCLRLFGGRVVGGDTDRHDELTVNGTAFGFAPEACVLKRSGAQPGDLVCVTGICGAAGVALDYVLVPDGPHASAFSGRTPGPQISRHLFMPCPRVFESRLLAAQDIVSSMTDTSDSLASSLHELAGQSDVGFEIEETRLPLFDNIFGSDGASNPDPADSAVRQYLLRKALYDGGDFELLFTVRADVSENTFEQLRSLFRNIRFSENPDMSHKFPARLSVIGRVVKKENGIVLIKKEAGKTVKEPISPEGYTAFAGKKR